MAKLRDFIRYYQQYKNKIFTYVLYRVSYDRDIAEDLTSEIFLKAYENFERFDEKRRFSVWIYTIAHNHLMTFLKTDKKTLPLDEAKTVSAEPSFVTKFENTMLMETILRYMKELPSFQQTVLLLRFQHGLSHREIAQIVERDEGLVRVTTGRALNTLRQKMHRTCTPKNL